MQATIGLTNEAQAKLGVSEHSSSSEVNAAVRKLVYQTLKLSEPTVGARGDSELDGMMFDLLARKLAKSGKLGDLDSTKLTKLARKLHRADPQASK